jgi:hypothetical protein
LIEKRKRLTIGYHPSFWGISVKDQKSQNLWEERMRSKPQQRCNCTEGRARAFLLATLGITPALITLITPHAARAQVVEVITRPGGQDTVNWGQLNLAPGTTFPTPQDFTSFGGIDGKATVDKNGVAVIQEQCCPTGIWDGNFNPGDILFDTSNTALTLTLAFKKPLKAIGTQIQANVLAAFIAQIQVFDHTRLLGTFRENSGGNLSAADGSAIFLGVASPRADITSVVYSVTINGSPDGFAINQVTISQ